ncbi:restriction endonuclease subunit S [Lactobacillus sp. 0.1XD8-4]|nr:restriction endonuclease subunit S [Lactobacillus sp. 0.1XD8-4]
MLQQLFVDKNSKQPNLRFKNFNGNWKERKLGELYSYHNGRAHEQNQKSNGKYELINLNSISIDGTLKSSGRYINHANEILRQNDLVMILSDIAHGKLLGRVAIIPQDNKYVLNQRVALLRPTSKNINSNFMVSLINNNQRYFHKMGIGTSQLNISKSTVTESLWQVPKIKEQLVVGKFLQNSAHVINLQQSKIDQLNILKKYLLQKLFI